MLRSVFSHFVLRNVALLTLLHLPLAAWAQGAAPAAYTPDWYRVVGVPVDFILFGLTVLGVALFHAHTLRIALIGVTVISLYKIVFTGFKFGPGVSGWVSHLGHEWVHIGYLAAIVAASNAGGAGSVVGDTTTTMLWISGVNPLQVFDAYVAATVALVIFGIPASLQQHKYSPILKMPICIPRSTGCASVSWRLY